MKGVGSSKAAARKGVGSKSKTPQGKGGSYDDAEEEEVGDYERVPKVRVFGQQKNAHLQPRCLMCGELQARGAQQRVQP
jgi:hypothetical protein